MGWNVVGRIFTVWIIAHTSSYTLLFIPKNPNGKCMFF